MEYSLNKVDAFNPFDYIEVAKDRHGEDIIKDDGTPLKYLATSAKVLWFRMVYPKGILKTSFVETPKQEYGALVRYKAEVWFDSDTLAAEWEHQETVWDIAEMDNVISKVQTVALGKALSRAGFGCEIELKLGIDASEGETPTEEPAPEPKKKRGRPKKTETPEPVESDNLDEEAEELLKKAEEALKDYVATGFEAEEVKEEESEAEEKTDTKIEELLEMKLETTESAPINIKKLDGLTIREVLADHENFGNLVKTRPNIRNGLTEECANAVIFIEENK